MSDDASKKFQEHRRDLAAQTAFAEIDAMFVAEPDLQQEMAGPTAPALPPPESESALTKVAKDVGRGALEFGPQVAGGIRDAIQNAVDLTYDVEAAMAKLVPAELKNLGENAEQALQDFAGSDENLQLIVDRAVGATSPQKLKLPEVGEAATNTGGFVRGAARFLTSFAAVGPAVRGLKIAPKVGEAGAMMVQGALADVVGDTGEENLSNFLLDLKSIPGARNAVTEFLAADPDATEPEQRLVNRLKTAGEGAIAGALLDGVVAGLKWFRARRILRSTMAEQARSGSAARGAGAPHPARAAEEVEQLGGLPITMEEIEAHIGGGDDAPWFEKGFDTNPRKEPKRPTGKDKIRDARHDLEGREEGFGVRLDNGEEVFVNLNRIRSPDDIKRLIQKMANSMSESIKGAQRGSRSHASTRAAASRVKALDLLMSRVPGETFNAEQLLAVRELWATSAERLMEAAHSLQRFPSDTNQFLFRRSLAIHQAIQKEVLGARTEAARALNSFNIVAGPRARHRRDLAMKIKVAMEDLGGRAVAEQAAAALIDVADNPRGMLEFLDKTVGAATKDAVIQAWYAALLSNPATHVANLASGALVFGNAVLERFTAAGVSYLRGGQGADRIVFEEGFAMIEGAVQGFRDALAVFAQTERQMTSDQVARFKQVWARPDTQSAIKSYLKNPVEDTRSALPEELRELLKRQTKLESEMGQFERLRQSLKNAAAKDPENNKIVRQLSADDSSVGLALNAIDVVTKDPGRALEVADEFMKTVFFRAEQYAQATRKVYQESTTGLTAAELKARRARFLELEQLGEEATQESVNAALINTFTSKPGAMFPALDQASQWVQRLGEGWAFPIGRYLMPFRQTPLNILGFTFERLPGLAATSERWRADFAAGGVRRDLAIAKNAMGALTVASGIDLALSGRITGRGPQSPTEREQWRNTHQPYSFRVGDEWFSYDRMDPLGMLFGVAADVADVMANAEENDDYADELAGILAASGLVVGQNLMGKSYMSGVADFFGVMDPRSSNASLFRYAGKALSSTIPAGLFAIRRSGLPGGFGADEYVREINNGLLDPLLNKIPALSKNLPLNLDMWGRPRSYRSGKGWLYDIASPSYVKKIDPAPIDTELQELAITPGVMGRSMTTQTQTIELDAEHEARFKELSGNKLKLPEFGGMGAFDYLNALVSGQLPESEDYQELSAVGKSNRIKKVIGTYREAAKMQLLLEYPDLQVRWEIQRQKSPVEREPLVLPMSRFEVKE